MLGENRFSGRSLVYGLIGDPVDHSLSPPMQNKAFQETDLDAVYLPFRVRASQLGTALRGLFVLGVKGFNVTLPHKVKVLRYLNSLDSTAAEVQSANTVLNTGAKLIGYNTDGIGALNALRETGIGVEHEPVLIFGAGGAARAIAFALTPLVSELRLVNRSQRPMRALAQRLRRKFKTRVVPLALTSSHLQDFVETSTIVINATSMGMDAESDVPIHRGWIHPSQTVFDIVYRPIETKLLRAAASAGARKLNGIDQLVHQGACSFKLWTGKEAPISAMREAIARQVTAVTHATNG